MVERHLPDVPPVPSRRSSSERGCLTRGSTKLPFWPLKRS